MNSAATMARTPLAGDGRPDLPPWGEVVLVVVWACLFVFIVTKLWARQRRR
ncbi:hypothetical protein ACF061_12575 [Streptomyces sp. NPDC015220]|uniref:hypothetical protein n=1 Tax=Streptomyces sp. NPDC015220 TaxID=3364947 RepID=UPI0036FA2A44